MFEGEFRSYGEKILAEIAPILSERVSSTRLLLSWTAGLLAFFALILFVVHFGSLARAIELATAAHPAWLLLAVFVQAATYINAASVWHEALSHAGYSRPLRTLIPLGIAKLSTDQALPSAGISGTMSVISGLIRRCVPPEVAMTAMLVGLISYNTAYLIIVFASIEILRLHNHANLPLFIGAIIFAVIMIALPMVILGVRRWGDRQPFTWLSRLLGMKALFAALAKAPTDLLRSPSLLFKTVGLQLGVFILDALTLWIVFNSIGAPPAPWVVFVSFTIASMVATVGPIPIGLGTFEASSVGMLSFLGVSMEAALTGTLLLRALTFWLPLLPGLWLGRRELDRSQPKHG